MPIEAAVIALAGGDPFFNQVSAPAAVFAVAALIEAAEVAFGQGRGGQRVGADVKTQRADEEGEKAGGDAHGGDVWVGRDG